MFRDAFKTTQSLLLTTFIKANSGYLALLVVLELAFDVVHV